MLEAKKIQLIVATSSILIAAANIYFVYIAKKYFSRLSSVIHDMRRSLLILKVHTLRQVKNERAKTAQKI